MTQNPVSGVTIGHVHLKVSDLDRSVAFYRDVIGLEVQQLMPGKAAFMSSDGYHHHLGLNVWHSEGSEPAPVRYPGLFHSAFLYPTREALSVALRRALDHGIEIEGQADHGVSQAIYFSDPDRNGIEIYWDRPREEWPRDADGNLRMFNAPLPLSELLELSA